MAEVARRRRGAAALAALTAALLVLAACSSNAEPDRSGTEPDDAPAHTRAGGPTRGGASAQPRAGSGGGNGDGEPVTIAFAGDVHFEGVLEGRLADPATAMGPLTRVLKRADLAIANLETAVTTRGLPQPKAYVFRDPPAAFDAVAAGGIDVVTMANNHALDFGPVSIPDALAAARARDFPVIGIGRDREEAFRPWIVSVRGQRIAFIGASAVVDAALVDTWSAGPHQAGVATALDGANAALVAAITRVRDRVDTVVVDMHYGSDLQQCPTDIQRGVVRDAVAAGADIVVGQHAHALLGAGYQGAAYVSYGLGNFQFYSANGLTAQTGVLTVTVDGRKVTAPRWSPGVVVGGLPTPLTGTAAQQAVTAWRDLRRCAGLTARPTAPPAG